jgi:hypothetical protein
MELYERSVLCPDRKRLQFGDQQEVQAAINLWFKSVCAVDIPTTWPFLTEKTQKFIRQIGNQDFEASSGWLFRFRERREISWKVVSGDEKSADKNLAKMWKEEKLLEIAWL